jgi:hypothetical protein
MPKSGIMDPSSQIGTNQKPNAKIKSGNQFKITFQPSLQLPSPIVALLIIETEEVEWSYKVIGKNTETKKRDKEKARK